MYIDNLVQEIKHLGVNCQICTLSILLHADDIGLIAPSAENLQNLIDTVAEWGMRINLIVQ